MNKSSFKVAVISIIGVIICLIVMAFTKERATIVSLLFLTMIIPLVVSIIAAFINGWLNSKNLSVAIAFNIGIAFVINLLILFFNLIFVSKDYIEKLTSTVQNSDTINLNIEVGGIGNTVSGFFIFIVFTALFSFIGAKLKVMSKK